MGADVGSGPLRVAMIGTRGVPANYGGFETAVEEVGSRLAARGHQVTVYCRAPLGHGETRPRAYRGMQLVHLPAARRRALETLSHTALSTAHAFARPRQDAILVFNAANAIFLPLLRHRAAAVATHVDGLEWQRGKWGPAGKRFYRVSESLAVRWSDRLIADARGITEYYLAEFGAVTDEIAYGAPILASTDAERVAELGLLPGKFHLVVARLEPENNVHLILDAYAGSGATLPLVVVGGTPYETDYTRELHRRAERTEGVVMLGGVWDQDQLDALYGQSLTYVHGHSVGGTNPSLLRAMGAGACVLAYDVVFNREVLGHDASVFSDPADLGELLRRAEADPEACLAAGAGNVQRAAAKYDWDDVADKYERLCRRLASGSSARGRVSGRRRSAC